VAGCTGMIFPGVIKPETRTNRAKCFVIWAQIVAWLCGVSLVGVEVASVMAASKTLWFERMSVAVALFGALSLTKLLVSRGQRDSAKDSAAAFAIPPDRLWNRFVLAGMILVLLVGLLKAPHRSNDVFAYGAYGRMVSEYSVSPYALRPSAFPLDPVITRMDPGWRDTRSVYGPVFTGVSALGMRVAGTSALRERLWFQILTALATGLSALLLKRMSPKHWWLFALNPVALIAVAHEGHNDALVGLGILSALWFVERNFLRKDCLQREFPRRRRIQGPSLGRQDVQQGVLRRTAKAIQRHPWFVHGSSYEGMKKRSIYVHGVLGTLVLAASIKITAILAAPALLMWILRHESQRRVARIGAGWIVVCGLLFAATGGPSAFAAFRGLRLFRSTTSLWHLDFVRRLTDTPGGKPGALALTLPAVALFAIGLLIVRYTFRLWPPSNTSAPANHAGSEHSKNSKDSRDSRDSRDSEVNRQTYFHELSLLAIFTLLPLVTFIASGLYVLPWYWGWLLAPAVLLTRKFRAAVVVAAAMHTLAYGAGTTLHGTFATVFEIARIVSPMVFAVTVVTGLTTAFGANRLSSQAPSADGRPPFETARSRVGE
jgi:hypothetical protein